MIPMPKPKYVMILSVVIHNPALIRCEDECDVMGVIEGTMVSWSPMLSHGDGVHRVGLSLSAGCLSAGNKHFGCMLRKRTDDRVSQWRVPAIF